MHALTIAFGTTVTQIGFAFLAGTVFYVLRRNTDASGPDPSTPQP